MGVRAERHIRRVRSYDLPSSESTRRPISTEVGHRSRPLTANHNSQVSEKLGQLHGKNITLVLIYNAEQSKEYKRERNE